MGHFDHSDEVTRTIVDREFPGGVGDAVVLVGSEAGEALPARIARHIADLATAGEDIVVRLNFILVEGVGSKATTDKEFTDPIVVGPDGEILCSGESV